jgi:ABC-type uncharacterized transport system ATPase subunit
MKPTNPPKVHKGMCVYNEEKLEASRKKICSHERKSPLAAEELSPRRPAGRIYMIRVGRNGAGEEIRTLDPNLGKVVLYH